MFLGEINVDEDDSLFELRVEREHAEVVLVAEVLAVGQLAVLEHRRRDCADGRVHAVLFFQDEVFDVVFHQAFEQRYVVAELLVVFREDGGRQLFVVANQDHFFKFVLQGDECTRFRSLACFVDYEVFKFCSVFGNSFDRTRRQSRGVDVLIS